MEKKNNKKKKNKKNKVKMTPVLEAIAKDYKERNIKTGAEAQNYLAQLLQPLMQIMLDAELDSHLNYSKYEHSGNKTNSRNGHCKSKKVKTTYGNIEVATPRDRAGTFEPVVIEKGETTISSFEDKCIAMYAKGMSLRDIEDTLKEIYKVKINKDDISRLISAVNAETERWKNRTLKPMYVFCYADCLYVPIRDNLKSEKKAIYVVIGVDTEGYKDVLGLWIDKTESGSFWCNVFEDIKSRGVKDILYVTSDGIAGFKGSLEMIFPKTQVQRCVVHLARNIYNLSPKKQAKEIIADFKTIYTSTDYESAKAKLEDFCNKYNDSNKNIVKKVNDFMQYLEPLFELPSELRKCIYTSNAVESVNSALRKVTRGKGSFPNEASVYKVMYLRIRELSEKWQKPIANWKTIQQQLSKLFGERYTKYLNL